MDSYTIPTIGQKAPHFRAQTTAGPVSFPEDYQGRWVILFSHPGGFTPVCTTEMLSLAHDNGAFARRGCALLGLSVDSNLSNIAWVRAMEGYRWGDIQDQSIPFPIVADDMGRVAQLYGMLMPDVSSTRTVRSVFYVDPQGVIRAILVYPLSTGRSTAEMLRLLEALQTYDATGMATPCNWQPGQPGLMPAPQTAAESQKRGGPNCLSWYACFAATAPGASGAGRSAATGSAAQSARPASPAANQSGRQSSGSGRQAGAAAETAARAFAVMPEQNVSSADRASRSDPPARARVRAVPPPENVRSAADVRPPADRKSDARKTDAREPSVRRADPSAQIAPATSAHPRPSARRLFTLKDLSAYDGRNGRAALASIGGLVYDIGTLLASSPQMKLLPGRDLSRDFLGLSYLLTGLPVVGQVVSEAAKRAAEERSRAAQAAPSMPQSRAAEPAERTAPAAASRPARPRAGSTATAQGNRVSQPSARAAADAASALAGDSAPSGAASVSPVSNAAASNAAASNTAASNTAASNTAASNTAASNAPVSSNPASNTVRSSAPASNTAASSTPASNVTPSNASPRTGSAGNPSAATQQASSAQPAAVAAITQEHDYRILRDFPLGRD